ncbi:DUF3231 family protein [Iocasia frigidifontis]|uniref:DUF3231 family protein n=1 Tax=Iocasia fonsfrigidae TaxID=2682810 RepID=A0A8A7KAV1_9FIRM|nr:DUF3231 family protein [Iocasia fonsfrigidae]QTL98963.1 DUF3231 family protein [Iocasia fonsfrigidae]
MSFIDKILKNKQNNNKNKALHHGEIFELWAHLVSRYDVLKKTQILFSYAHDPDFKMIISEGLDILESQIDELEDIFKEYSIPLPDRPPADVTSSSSSNPLWSDQMIYREILNGMSQFLDTHVRTFKFLWNDELRPVIVRFLKKEVDLYDDLMKYGKLKGWLNMPPKPEKSNN